MSILTEEAKVESLPGVARPLNTAGGESSGLDGTRAADLSTNGGMPQRIDAGESKSSGKETRLGKRRLDGRLSIYSRGWRRVGDVEISQDG